MRWIIGRAGTGKTALCVREMRAEMVRDPLGGALLWIVPEQATFTAERLLVTGAGEALGERRGTFRGQVLSFRRLAMMIARETGIPGAGGHSVAKPMDQVARIVLLEEMVRATRKQLTVFAGVADRPGFVAKLDGVLRELRQHGHSGTSLRAVVEEERDPVTSRKLLDLAVLLDGWSELVDGGAGAEHESAVDFERVMHAAALKAGESALIAGRGAVEGARVWVDGISAMSALEMGMLAALAEHGREVSITLLADPDAPGIVEARGGRSEEGDGLFARTERLFRRLTDVLRVRRVNVKEVVRLRERHRFASGALARIEEELFGEGKPPHVTGERPSVAAAPQVPPNRKKGRVADGQAGLPLFKAADSGGHGTHRETQAVTSGAGAPTVEIWECSDPETEVRAVAQAIRDLVTGGAAGPGLRFRQIGVILPDMPTYADALRRVFAEHRIAHFIDQPRGMAHHPIVEFVRGIVAIATSRWDREDLLLYLKTGLAGVSADEAAWTENYVIAHGIARVPWSDEWKWIAPNVLEDSSDETIPESQRALLKRVNAVREKVWGDLREWWAQATSRGDSQAGVEGGEWVRGLHRVLEKLGVAGQVEAWAKNARDAGQEELALVHEQVWREMQELLATLELVLVRKRRTLAEFEQLLATALESMKLALIPPTVDQVLVSSVERSRVPELDVVFLVGAAEGQFPKVTEEDVILSDRDRAAFNAHASESIGEGSDRQLLEMPFFDYVALTRAGRRLIVSYPVAGRQGRVVGRSRYIRRLRELLGDALIVSRFDAESRMQVERIGTAEDLLTGVAAWARAEIRGLAEAASTEMEAAYDFLAKTSDAHLRSGMAQVWQALRGGEIPRLSAALARRFFPPRIPLAMSVSQLEQFAACPLQYFMSYTMGLRIREEFALDAMNLGAFYHAILERIYRKIIDGEFDWPGRDGTALREVLEAEVDAAAAELHAELAPRTPGYERMRTRTKRTLGVVLEADRRRAAVGNMRPRGVEVWFGYKTQVDRSPGGQIVSLPVLDMPIAGGANVHVRGKIDRLDFPEGGQEEASVIDYKSASKKYLLMQEVYAGLSLQLPVYALAVRQLAGHTPIAALYFGLGMSRQRVNHRGEAVEPDSDPFYQQFKPRGMIDMKFDYRLDASVRVALRSNWYNMGITTEGAPYKSSDAMASEDFATVLDFAQWKISALAGDLMAGTIAPAPFRKPAYTPCLACEYAGLCPFDRATGQYREIEKFDKQVAIGKMREAMGH